MEELNKPLWQLTIGEFVEILDSKIPTLKPEEKEEDIQNRNYVYGLAGLAKILGCSKNHASKLKSSGMFDEAIIQNGRKIIIDPEKALKLFNKH